MEADIKELCDKHGEDVVHKALMAVDAAEAAKGYNDEAAIIRRINSALDRRILGVPAISRHIPKYP